MGKNRIVDKDKKNKEKDKEVVFAMELYYDKAVKMDVPGTGDGIARYNPERFCKMRKAYALYSW